jgi:hypothetical protein
LRKWKTSTMVIYMPVGADHTLYLALSQSVTYTLPQGSSPISDGTPAVDIAFTHRLRIST